MWVAGVDGCAAGWVAILQNMETGEQRCRLLPRFADVAGLEEQPAIIAVDIPIGLLDAASPGGRECDRQVRRLLGRARASSVFPPPARAALAETTYAKAAAVNRASSPAGLGISQQCFGLFRKLREVDELMTPALQERIKEIHPELSFYALNGDRPIFEPKRSPDGEAIRRALLSKVGFGAVVDQARTHLSKSAAGMDDILDACVACWTARRILEGTAVRVCELPERDSKGLCMEMWR